MGIEIKSMEYEDFGDNESLELLTKSGGNVFLSSIDSLLNWGPFTTVAGGTFILDSDLLPNTSYTVWASIGGATPKQGSQTLTIAADGTGALLAIAIAT